MEIGVVLPVYNQKPHYIDECIQSLESQNFRDFQIVIVIDGANQETVQAVYEATKMLTIPYEIILRNENKGIAYSLNQGFSHLNDCRFLTWVSSDNRHYPDFLQTLYEQLVNASKETVLVYSLFNLIDQNGINRDNDEIRRNKMVNFMSQNKEEILQQNFIGASFLFKQSAFVKAGGYDSMFEKVEDYEFWIRLLRIGEIKFIPHFLMEYRLNGEHSYTTITPREDIKIKSTAASNYHRLKQGDTPKVTVMISFYNERKFIRQAIGSVLNQTFKDFQLILIDDGSTDNPWEEIFKYNDSRIIPLKIENGGKARALNIGLAFALGEYILELDGDDWLEHDTLQTMVEEMSKQPDDVGLCYGNRKKWIQRRYSAVPGPVYKGMNYKNKYEVLTEMKTHCPRLYRKSALNHIGGWPISKAEDFKIMLKLADHYKFYWIDKTFYNQRRHKNNITLLQQKENEQQIKEMIEEVLKEWGDIYKPEFIEKNGLIEKVNLSKNNNR
ncbi:glycosyltransferase [Neobacillus sp. 3P2-tot-E-2]|uniref:glycosyltransferase family 2 protein n=1 Tax=Neobacillus sp. 3P2-tot-E-2 TaxID=3132212 RepID=UPI00399F8020